VSSPKAGRCIGLLGDIVTSGRQGSKGGANWTIFDAPRFETAVVGDEEHLTSVAKVPLPPEAFFITEGDVETDKVAGLGWPGLRASLEVFRGELSEIRVGRAPAATRFPSRSEQPSSSPNVVPLTRERHLGFYRLRPGRRRAAAVAC
jgi:hypothetical protein